jgi:hypothetical protein
MARDLDQQRISQKGGLHILGYCALGDRGGRFFWGEYWHNRLRSQLNDQLLIGHGRLPRDCWP